RAGIKSIIVIKKMNAEGTKTIDDGVLVYDGHENDPTIEGPKIYKRNNYYYIFAPAGGVSTGWQTVLRSKNIYGPYERKVVMDQGSTTINGPHQGAWVTTQTGEDWFIHFQDKGAYGRVVHLQPMKWINDWPLIGVDKKGTGIGEPVINFKKPRVGKIFSVLTPAESDEFDENTLGLQWQWQANPKPYWHFLSRGKLRLYSAQLPDSINNYWNVPNLLMQKFPAEEFMATTKLSFKPRLDGERAGLIVFGTDYAYVSLVKKTDGNYISFSICKAADKGNNEIITDAEKIISADIFLRVTVRQNAICEFSYSNDGNNFKPIGEKLKAKPGKWVGAKVGLFCTRTTKTNDAGNADVDWFKIEVVK
ncbi:MAG: family 43 glycosylhydrolase, partial [Ferruginibacter sp.]